MNFNQPQQPLPQQTIVNQEGERGSVAYSRNRDKELWKTIDEVSNGRFNNDSREFKLLAQELDQYLRGLSSVDFDYWQKEDELEGKVKKLKVVIETFLSNPTQSNAQKVGSFFG